MEPRKIRYKIIDKNNQLVEKEICNVLRIEDNGSFYRVHCTENGSFTIISKKDLIGKPQEVLS